MAQESQPGFAPLSETQKVTTSPSSVEIPVAAVPTEEEQDSFNGAQYLQDNGLTLVDTTDKMGVVRVRDSFGNEQDMNFNKMLAEAGVNPTGLSMEYNSPENAIDRSPVGFGDRIKLALGNAKGQINYLKANYQDASLAGDGTLKVKDKGAWYNVDARGLGDGSGWDMAKELVGDFADLTDIGIQGGAQVGLAFGTGGASIAAAGVGAGVGKALTSALGRVVGTYDATPQDVVRDIGLDAMFGMVGQGIALGGKAAIVGTMNKAMKLFEGAEPQVRNMAANVVASTTGMSQQGVLRSMERADMVNPITDRILQKASAVQGVISTGNPLDNQVASAVIAGSQEAIDQAAIGEGRLATKAIVDNAQSKLSNIYRQGMDVAEAVMPDAHGVEIAGPTAKYVGGLMERMPGVLTGTTDAATGRVSYAFNTEKAMRAFEVGEIEANGIGRKLLEMTGAMQEVIHNTGETSGKAGFRRAVDVMQKQDDLYFSLVDGRPRLEEIFHGLGPSMKNEITQSLPEAVRSQVNRTSQFYKDNKPAVEFAQKALKSPDGAGLDGIMKQLMAKGGESLDAKLKIDKLANLTSGGNPTGPGKAALDHLYDTLAAREKVGALPKELLAGQGVIRSGLNVVGKVIGPKIQINAASKGLNILGSTMRVMSETQRKAVLANPAQFGALLSQALGEGTGK